MCGNIFEVGITRLVQRNAFAIVDNLKIKLPIPPAPYNGDVFSLGINAILYELGDRFQRIVLGERNNSNGVPAVSDPELAAVLGTFFCPGC